MAELFPIDPASGLWLAAVAVLTGLIRGFAGFGTALVYVPLAGMVLPPLWVLITLTVMGLIGPLPNVPRALRDGHPGEVLWIGAFATLGLLPGLWLLDKLPEVGFRWLVSALVFATLLAMICGWRWNGALSPRMLAATGGVSGLLGGASGLSGPPVILAYLSSTRPVAAVRACILLYLVLWDLLFGLMLWARGMLDTSALWLGVGVILPYLAANIVGARFFDPAREGFYRQIAYAIIGAAAVLSLPLWD